MKLIAFTGQKGSGKDTAASVFINGAGYEHVKMAGALKAMLRTLLEYQGTHPGDIHKMIDGSYKEFGSEVLCGRSARYAMQTLGTEWGRDLMHPDFWIKMTEVRCRLFNKVVISDVRFPNEVEMVHRLGGKVYRIDRGSRGLDSHPSEALIETLDVDAVIANSAASAEEFCSLIRERIAP